MNHLLFQIPVSLSNVGFVPLYGGNQTQKILALFAPEDSLTGLVFVFVLRDLNSNCQEFIEKFTQKILCKNFF